MQKFFYKEKLIGIRCNHLATGITILSEPAEPLQILGLKHPKGKKVEPHFHKPMQRITDHLQECVIVMKGKIKIDLYGPDNKHFKKLYLKAGELFVLISGGHAITTMENTEIFEIKNGPFKNDRADF